MVSGQYRLRPGVKVSFVTPQFDVWRVELAAPQGAADMHGWAPEVIGAVGAPEPNPQGYLDADVRPWDVRLSG